jgi:hypothetical protein
MNKFLSFDIKQSFTDENNDKSTEDIEAVLKLTLYFYCLFIKFLYKILLLLFFKFIRLKKKADKAFREENFEKAHKLYSKALEYDDTNYDLIACFIGAALNLGRINEVIEKCDYLIDLDNTRAQVKLYYNFFHK